MGQKEMRLDICMRYLFRNCEPPDLGSSGIDAVTIRSIDTLDTLHDCISECMLYQLDVHADIIVVNRP